MKKTGILLGILLLCGQLLQAQPWLDRMKDIKRNLERRVDKQQKNVNRQYGELMQHVWTKTQLLQMPAPEGWPKPHDPVIYDPTIDLDRQDMEFDFDLLIPDGYQENARPEARPRYLPPTETIPEPEDPELDGSADPGEVLLPALPEDPALASYRQVSCSFLGRQFPLQYDPGLFFEMKKEISEAEVGDKWLQLEEADYERLMYQLGTEGAGMKLNDWGFCMLINEASRQIYPNDPNAQTLFNHFMITQAGYRAGICHQDDQLYLMLPTQQRIYSASYLQGKEHRYYVVDLNGNKLQLDEAFVLNGAYPKADKLLDLRINSPMKLGGKNIRRELSFSYGGKTYQLEVRTPEAVVDFYRSFPLTDIRVTLTANLSRSTFESLIPHVREWTAGLSEQEAVNLMLRFVQTAFGYKTDTDQFGYENYLFIEETLYYPYSDCEDRSVLFSYLVREILGLPTLYLVFPGHAATAVRFSEKTYGDFVTYQGEKYIICDPTYVNASYGRAMPEVSGKKTEIVVF